MARTTLRPSGAPAWRSAGRFGGTTSESDAAFGVLRRHDPGLGDVLDALMRDHDFLGPLLDRLEVLVADAPANGDRTAVERALAGIAAVLENHLAYEDRVLVSVLDDLQVQPGSADDGALRVPLRDQ